MLRRKESHKGDNGRVLIVGGSEDYVGAVALVGEAALAVLRSGADLVQVVAPEKVAWAINLLCPDIITHKMKGKSLSVRHLPAIKKLVRKCDVLVIGNGLGEARGTKGLVQELVKVNKPKVIDADALKMIKLQDVCGAVLTPHHTEFEILCKHSKIKEADVQKRLRDNTLVLKGSKTYVISKDKKVLNKTGNASMTKGGTGDVLAGLIAGLIAQGENLFSAATLGAKINGKIGDGLYKKKGFGYLASEIPQEIKKYQKIK